MDMMIERKLDNEADSYMKAYESIIPEVAEEIDKRYDGHYSFSKFDTVALGRYLKTWESYLPVFEGDATSQDSLGEILKVGLDLVALQYATLPIQFLASVQPLSEEAGVVYYRRAIATATRAGVSEGDVLIGTMGKAAANLPDYMSEEVINESTTIAAGPSPGPYAYSLLAPVRRRSMTVNIAGKIKGVDDGGTTSLSTSGNILGVGIDPDASTINYETGAFTITLINPGAHGILAGDTITVIYSQDITQATEIPGFKYDVIGKTVAVKYFLLQAQFTSLANYVVRRRFGKSLSDDIARDTVAQVNGAVLLEAIKKFRIAAIQNEVNYSYTAPTWSMTPSPGVSDIDHRRTFTDIMELAANKIEDMSGRSSVSFLIVGQKARQILNSIGFSGERKQVPGPYLAGYFEGLPVFYCPTTCLPADEILFGYRGLMWYESPLVYGPFLPTTLVKTSGMPNVFVETYGVAHGAAIESVVPEFIVRGRLTT